MGSIKPLIIVIFLSIYIQNIQCKYVGDEIQPANDLLKKPYALATRDRDLRGVIEQINDAADEIKNRALASWNYLKRVAEGTRRDIQKWVNSAREYGIKLEKLLEDQLKAWQNSLKNIFTDILGDVKEVQQCLKDESKSIADSLSTIFYDSAECLVNQKRKLRPINGKQEKIAVNDTLFIADLDRKLEACKADNANYEECLNIVGDLVYEDIEEKHNEIQNTGIELRGLADNIRENMVDCAERNVEEAASVLISKAIDIIKCALRREGINKPILE